MVIDEKKSSMYARIGSRAAFGMAMFEMAKEMDELMVLTADTSTSAGLDRFKKKYPEKFLDIGIAEQNMMGIAAGLASEGIDVVTATFSPFQTLRCCEQIKVNLGYMKHKVVFVGLASGVVLGNLGYTHCSIEDTAVMRSLPNIAVVSPADPAATAKAIDAALSFSSSVYIRLTGGANATPVYTSDFTFDIGKGIRLRDGQDIAIISTGAMVSRALQAAQLLEQEGRSCTVVDMHTIKPIDKTLIDSLCQTHQFMVTIEEHSVIGGLGSAVAEASACAVKRPPQLILGIADSYAKSGSYETILDHYGLTPEAIAASIKEGYIHHV